MACRGWLAPVFTPPHATKASRCVELYPLHRVGSVVPSLLHWGTRPWVIQNALRTPLKLHAPAFWPVRFLPPAPAAFQGVLSSFSAGLRLPSSSAPLSCWLVLPASLPPVLFGIVGFPSSCWLGLFLCLFCASLCCLFVSVCFPGSAFVLVGFASCQFSEVTKDGWGLSTPTTHTHPPLWLPSSPFFGWGLVCPLNSFVCCFGLAVLLLGPLARTSYSVRE